MFLAGTLYASNLSPPELAVYDNVETIFAGDQDALVATDQIALLSIDIGNGTIMYNQDTRGYYAYIGDITCLNMITNKSIETNCYSCLSDNILINTTLMQKLYRCQINYRSYYANIGYNQDLCNYSI